MFTERSGLIVWVTDTKPARNLERYGTVHYISKKMQYVAMYVHADKLEDTMRNLQRLPYVKKVERSYRNEIKTEYTSNMADKTRFYSL
ncbi:YlbG family protein [Paenibacillus aurantius]|uniref:YlbG family protein n=1 Tax=Paenibacillus aurantius TaxID=2918900 RepID=A0AA96LI15_9BACL|nr:YlbG family protein [Paenibacillus aurantius]WJH33206.1 YlbG family protein [Paenibacillus sp. CC-CFT747]WNQ13654.1 YlbG family protein [Paenibacillus aurantius]